MIYKSLSVEFLEEDIRGAKCIDPLMKWIGIVDGFDMRMIYSDIRGLASFDSPNNLMNKIRVEEGIKGKIEYIPQDWSFFNYSICKSKSICIGEKHDGKYRMTLGVNTYYSKIIFGKNSNAHVVCKLNAQKFDNTNGDIWSDVDYVGSGRHAPPRKDFPIKWKHIENIVLGDLVLTTDNFEKIEIEINNEVPINPENNIILSIKREELDNIRKRITSLLGNNIIIHVGKNIISARIDSVSFFDNTLVKNIKLEVKDIDLKMCT